MSKSGKIIGMCRICYDNIYEAEKCIVDTENMKEIAHKECFYDMLVKLKKVRSILDE